jgi:hypothetical protein
MDGTLFDRITRTLADHTPRREAVQALAGSALATIGLALSQAPVLAKCRKRLQTCGGKAKKKCCNKSGLIRCRHPAKHECAEVHGTGRRCCGLDGASCDPTLADCDCCGFAVCVPFLDGPRCEDNPK